MRRLLYLMLLILALPAFGAGLLDSRPSSTLGGGSLDNSKDFLPVRQAFQLSLIETTPESIKLRLVATDGYYLYRHRFQFRTEPADIGLGEAQLPKGEQKHDEYFGDVEVYHGILDIDLPRKPGEQRPFTLAVTYQGCADKGLCYPPETERLNIGDVAASPAVSASATTAATSAAWSWKRTGAVFPRRRRSDLHPLCTADAADSVRRGAARQGWRPARPESVTGLRTADGGLFCLARRVDGYVWREPESAGTPAIGLGSGAVFSVFVIFAIAMFGAFELRLPQSISSRLDRIAGKTEGGSLWGAAVLGVVSSLLVSPVFPPLWPVRCCISAPAATPLVAG